ncbi:MAG: M16 family metallopeptidase [Candidatus Krumholzibacteriia bacterium]
MIGSGIPGREGLGTPGHPSRPGRARRVGDAQHTRLANGLDVLVVENDVVPLVTIEIDVKNGAYTETPEYDGLSHLYEHMFFKANERIPDQEAYLRRARELGMEWNGTTSDERVNYFFTLHRKNLEAGLQFMSDAIRTPLFRKDEIERERPVVLGEYDRAESDPTYHLVVAVQKAIWHTYYTRKNVLGTREIIETATTEKMRTIQKRFYVPNNSALLISGDVDPDAALQAVESIFGDWQRGPDPFEADPIPHHPPLETRAAFVVEKPVQAISLLAAFHGPSVELDRQATYAADVFSFILGQRNSRFYRRLVDSGLCASASLSYQTLRYTGPVHVFLRTDVEHFRAAHEALWDEISHFADADAFSDQELENAKHQLEVDHIYELERPSQHVHTVGYWWAVADLDYYHDYVANLRRVSREDIVSYVRRYIVGQPSVTGVLLSPEMRARLGDPIGELQP